jgi:hypothetical protein
MGAIEMNPEEARHRRIEMEEVSRPYIHAIRASATSGEGEAGMAAGDCR